MLMTDRLSNALALAIEGHKGQVRKGTSIPYVSHLMGVASLALEFGADEDQSIAALLHDILEDGGPQYGPLIREKFGERVLAIVEGCTDGVPDASGRKAEWGERKRAYLEHLAGAPGDVLLVSGCDKLHNARAIVGDLLAIGPVVFDRFTTGRDGTLWYYRELAAVFTKRSAPMAAQLSAAVEEMHLLVGDAPGRAA